MLKVEHTPNVSMVKDRQSFELEAEFWGPNRVALAEAYIRYRNPPDLVYENRPIWGGSETIPLLPDPPVPTPPDPTVDPIEEIIADPPNGVPHTFDGIEDNLPGPTTGEFGQDGK